MLTYEQRADLCQNAAAIKLLRIIANKKTNLALSVDVVKKVDLLALADLLGPEICILKTHIDIVEDFDRNTIKMLEELANKHNFILFEDRKFADIGYTVQLQYEKGIYEIAKWARITNAHGIPGPSIIEGLKQVGLPLGNGLLLLAEMSTQGSLAKGQYTEEIVKMALANRDFVIGFIAQRKLLNDPTFIHLTPGVQTKHQQDDLGQRYHTPWQAIFENETDVIIVGRGIYSQKDPLMAARIYREQGWDAYLKRLPGLVKATENK
jgi:orotidine-5'-phosphate decarboxylase